MESAAIALASTVSLVLLCYLFFWLFRSTEIDRFRLAMFMLRDEMFLDAAKGLIPFNHPAYGTLRVTMNGYIRFGHRLSVWHLLYMLFLTQGHGIEQYAQRINSWEKISAGLNQQQLQKMNAYRVRMDAAVAWHFSKLFPECIFVWLALVFIAGVIAILFAIVLVQKHNISLSLEIVRRRVARRIESSNEGLNAMACTYGS